jgi:uncharacterized protein (UPF0276 family)
MIERRPAAAGWLEVHSENYFGAGGQPHAFLEALRADYPLSLHGVGLGLGSTDAIDIAHIGKLKALIERYQPALVSEHLCWTSAAGHHLNDLLPLPYTAEALEHVRERVSRTQDLLGRQILVENISSYLRFRHSTIEESAFLAEVAQRTGCGILLDVNNVYVNAVNHRFDAYEYIRAIPAHAVQEIHLAGHEDAGACLIDTHGTTVSEPVWKLYEDTIALIGPRATLIEWDTDIPALDTLLAQARHAALVLDAAHAVAV